MKRNRDTRGALLDGALECLTRKGYARTTARDIAEAADANLALIAYYYGSKEALLNEALLTAFERWLEQVAGAAEPQQGGSPSPAALAAAHLETALEEHRALLVAFVEALAQAERSPALRRQLARGYEQLRSQTAELVSAMVEDPGDARLIASVLIAVADGLMVQHLLDPSKAPSPRRIAQRLEPVLAAAAG